MTPGWTPVKERRTDQLVAAPIAQLAALFGHDGAGVRPVVGVTRERHGVRRRVRPGGDDEREVRGVAAHALQEQVENILA